MEEKKIKDLTGNREEKIASKKPVDREKEHTDPVKKTAKRPFVRSAQNAKNLEEHISAKPQKTEAPKAPSEPKEKRENKDQPRPDRRDRPRRPEHGKHKNDPAKKPIAEKQPEKQPEKEASPVLTKEKPQNGKNRHDRRPNKPNKAEQAPARPEKQAQEAPKQSQPKKDNRPPRKERPERPEKTVRLSDTVAENAVPEAPRTQSKAKIEVFTDEQLREDGLLFTLDEQPTAKKTFAAPEPTEKFEVIGVRFRGAGKTYYFSPNGVECKEGDHVVLETVRGMEYGEVLQGNRFVPDTEVVQPLKPILRKATPGDDAHFRENCLAESQARPIFLEKVQKNKLEMQLVDVEYTFDNTKLCFYFTAEGRVDFRELVKDLASVFRTRIELRQIGVRDEARMFGGLGICGRPFCCKSFLPDFVQVSIRMAKDQNLSLASSKISGSCGRLMCCLRYEQDTYEKELSVLPKVGSAVDTPKGRGMVLESNFLTGKIKVSMDVDHVPKLFSPEEVTVLSAPKNDKNAKEEQPLPDESITQ